MAFDPQTAVNVGGFDSSTAVDEDGFDTLQAARAFLQGQTFGSSDELGAAIAAVAQKLSGAEASIPDIYADIHGTLSHQRDQFAEENPGIALATELAGGIATGGAGVGRVMGSQAVKNAPRLAKLAAGSGTAGAEGLLYGGLSADPGERAKGAATGGIVGATLSPIVQGAGQVVASAAGPYVGRAAASIDDALGNMATKGRELLFPDPDRNAKRVLSSVLSREGIDSIDELPKGGGGLDLTLADVSEGARNLSAGIAADVDNPGVAKYVHDVMGLRNNELTGRVFRVFDEAADIKPGATIKEAVDGLKQHQSAAAGPLYREAAKTPIMMSAYMKAVLSGKDTPAKLWKKAQRTMDTRRKAGEQIGNFSQLDQWKKNMDDAYESLMRKGKKGEARDILITKNRVVDDIDKQVPAYKKARGIWADDASLISAGERGKKILSEDLDELGEYFDGLGASEKAMYKLGMQKAIREKLMQGREGTQTLNRIRSQLNMERFKKVFPTEKSFDEFKKAIDMEARAFETYRLLAQGSKTGQVQSAQRALKGDYGRSLSDIPTNTLGAVNIAIKQLMSSGLKPAAREKLGRMMLTPLKDLSDSDLMIIERKLTSNLTRKARSEITRWFREPIETATVTAAGIAEPIIN